MIYKTCTILRPEDDFYPATLIFEIAEPHPGDLSTRHQVAWVEYNPDNYPPAELSIVWQTRERTRLLASEHYSGHLIMQDGLELFPDGLEYVPDEDE